MVSNGDTNGATTGGKQNVVHTSMLLLPNEDEEIIEEKKAEELCEITNNNHQFRNPISMLVNSIVGQFHKKKNQTVNLEMCGMFLLNIIMM